MKRSGKDRIRTFGGRAHAPQKSLLALFEGTPCINTLLSSYRRTDVKTCRLINLCEAQACTTRAQRSNSKASNGRARSWHQANVALMARKTFKAQTGARAARLDTTATPQLGSIWLHVFQRNLRLSTIKCKARPSFGERLGPKTAAIDALAHSYVIVR